MIPGIAWALFQVADAVEIGNGNLYTAECQRCAHFGVTEQQLRDAVKKVGPMVADVKRHLGK